jgi:hypothetical protein
MVALYIVIERRSTLVTAAIEEEKKPKDPAAALYEYAPIKQALVDPPYEFAPRDMPPLVVLIALQFEHGESLTWTATSVADVAPHVLLLLKAPLLALQEYDPTYKTLIDPPYEFAPHDAPPLVAVNDVEVKEAVLWTRTVTLLAVVAPHVLLLLLGGGAALAP